MKTFGRCNWIWTKMQQAKQTGFSLFFFFKKLSLRDNMKKPKPPLKNLCFCFVEINSKNNVKMATWLISLSCFIKKIFKVSSTFKKDRQLTGGTQCNTVPNRKFRIETGGPPNQELCHFKKTVFLRNYSSLNTLNL